MRLTPSEALQGEAFNAAFWVVRNRFVNENNTPIEFYNHRFLLKPYMDNSPRQVIMKGSQVGWSTLAILRAFHLSKFAGANIIYSLPSKNIVRDFVIPKVDKLIESNPRLREMMGKTDSITLKQIGGNFVYFRSSWEPSSAISISAHILINDEVDRSNLQTLETLQSRLDAAKLERPELGWEWRFSNPSIPGAGVSLWWDKSDQKHWFVKCFEENTVVLAKINNPNIGVTIISMRRLYNLCKEPENLIDGCFVKYPQDIFIFSKNGWTKLSRVVKSKPEKSIKYTNFSSSYIETTEDHPFITNRGIVVQKKLKIKDVVNSICRIGRRKLKTQVSKPFMDGWILGFYLAEGNLIKDKNSKKGVKGFVVCQKKYSKITKDIEKRLKIFNPSYYERICGIGKQILMSYWYIFNTRLAEKISKLGNNSYNKRLPDRFISYPKNYIWSLISGLVDGDGTIYKDTVSIRISSKELVYQLYVWMRVNNIRASISRVKNTKLYRIQFAQTKNLHFSLKYNNICPSKKYKPKNKEYIKNIGNREKPEFVYDVTTQTGDLYANGIFIHNCPSCSYEWYLKWPDSIDMEREIYICTKCHNELTNEARRTGRWVNKKASNISGYWISQMMCTWKSAAEIIEKSRGEASIFHNFTLGLPYISQDQSVSRQSIVKCLSPDINPRTDVAMGVDNGVVKTYVIGNKYGIFEIGETKSWEEIENLRNRYNAYMVVDMLPYPNTPKKLIEKYRGKVWGHYFGDDKKEYRMVRWGEKERWGIVYSDRVKIIDFVVAEINSQDVTFNLTLTDMEQFISDWEQLYRVVEETRGIMTPSWRTIEGRRDHFCFAQIYFRIALDRTMSQGEVLRTPAKETEQHPEVAPDHSVPALDLNKVKENVKRGKRDWRIK